MKLRVLVPETKTSWQSPAASHDGQFLPPEAVRRGDKKGKPTKVMWQGEEGGEGLLRGCEDSA